MAADIHALPLFRSVPRTLLLDGGVREAEAFAVFRFDADRPGRTLKGEVMFERLDRSFGLAKASAAILLKDRALLVFPLISSVAAIAVIACFALPLGGMHALDALSSHGRALTSAQYATAFLFYLSQYFVIFFFNTALVGAVMMQLDGGEPTVGDGLRIAASKVYPILGYAFVAATVGMVLRAIQERVGFVGKMVVGLLGVGWTLATYLVIPVLAAQDVGPLEAIKESAELFKRTWGENMIGQAGIGLAFGLIYLGVILCGAVLVVMAATLHSAFLMVVMAVVAIGAVVLTALVHAALSGIYAAALYRYATDSGGTSGFDNQALEQAFQPAD